MNIKNTLEESFEIYAGMTIQKRAIVDARDCLKPSARLSIYSQYIDKIIPSKPYEKSSVSVASAMRHFYPYGDAGLYSMLARMGKPFAMRYKLEDFQGSTGDITEDDNQAAMRYTNMRLSPLAMNLFKDIEKDTIKKWYDSYTGKEQYPSVLTSKGFYNIVNGSLGIATAISASIPQFNLIEVNNALITLLKNPNCDFDDIYCTPDFTTGSFLLNEEEVRDSLKNGQGKACKLRAKAEFLSDERCIVFTEIPYGVYTGTIAEQIGSIMLSENNPGIIQFWDQSGNESLIKVQIDKKASPDKIIKYLYKNTSLQYYYGINLTMLNNGKVPKVFTWKEALQAHIDHEKEVYRNGFNFDLNKINGRLHIIDGLLKAISILDEVIAEIKRSSDTKTASITLQNKFGFSEKQAKAILDIKLSRLAHLEISKLQNEQDELKKEKNRIEEILSNEELFNQQLINGWQEVAEKFGDERRTKVLNLIEEDGEPIEVKTLQLSLTNKNSIFISEASSLYTQKRGGVGNKLKMNKGEYIISTISVETNETILLFTQDGDFYSYDGSNLPVGEKVPIESLINLKSWQKIKAIASINEKNNNNFILFITKNGYIKKSEFSEYNTNRSIGIRAITLDKNDEITNVLFTNNDKVGIVTEFGNFIIIETKDIRPIGRVTRGIKAIKLNDGDCVSQAHLIPYSTKEILSISNSGFCKRTAVKEFSIQGKNTKGSKIQKLIEGDLIADFAPITNEKEILIAATSSCIKLLINDIPSTSKNTQGNKTIKLSSNDLVIGLSIY